MNKKEKTVKLNRLIKQEAPDWLTDEEYQSMGCNVLALDSNTAIMVEGNPITKSRLESEGIKVLTYPGNEISVKGTGGPTCLTRPLLRTK